MFRIINQSKISSARIGQVSTPHGVLKTPFFMPDATRAVLKNISVEEAKKIGLEAMVVNTFHLYLQPGTKLIKHSQGVHSFMNWSGPLLSDSGGYQVFSLIHKNSHMGKISDQYATFKSPLDGSLHKITPEKSIQIQFDLGTDMIVVFDDCPPNDYDFKKTDLAVERTIKWALRCKKEFIKQVKKRKLTTKNTPLLFGVVQGGMYLELRKKCAQELSQIGFDGLGFGGRHVDNDGKFLDAIMSGVAQTIKNNDLRFALGVGKPEDIVKAITMGWDMFDCVIPTREGRHGRIYKIQNYKSEIRNFNNKNFYKIININNAEFAKKNIPINKDSKLKELRKYSLSYLHHLFKISDPLGQRLASLNNLEFYLDLMAKIRYGIEKGKI